MKLDRISLENYRNIAALTLQPVAGMNVIYGENAQGKTNLIEAIWMFTGAKSFRGSKDKELIRFHAEAGHTDVAFTCGGRVQSASIDLTASGKKTAQLNEITLDNATRFAGQFYAVVFSPAHLALIREGPVERRRFLDTAICQVVPKYEAYLRKYTHILTQRNALLKDLSRYPQLIDTAVVWEEHLAKVAAAIITCRARYLRKLAPLASQVYDGISGGREQLLLTYLPNGLSAGCNPAESTREECKENFLVSLKEMRRADIERGITSVGPHRDDLEFLVNGAPLRLYGSQGQQRSAVLALKMAECGMIEEAAGETPVILLDDVMSELDANRREYLLNRIVGKQVFVTCCDEQSFRSMKEGKTFHIKAGQLQKQDGSF